jgi:16S rRNA (uracil1498-N3)-methyltransferase
MSPTGALAGPPGGSTPHLLVHDVSAPRPDGPAWHHLTRVLRTRVGSSVTVTDGAGRWRSCVVSSLGSSAGSSPGSLEPAGEVAFVPRPEPGITVAFALTKGDKPELVVQKLTELGIDRIVPFRAARSVVRWDAAKVESAQRRFRKVARSAVEQARSCWLPELHPLTDVGTLAEWGAARADRGGDPPSLARCVLAVGPEGGWDDHERELLPTAVGLGPHVLRAETAALTAGTVMCSIRSGLVAENTRNAKER